MVFTENFYKYTSAETALNYILQSSSLRFSNPKKFNDPFDVIPGSLTPFDLESAWAEIQNYHKDAVKRGYDLKALREGKVKLVASNTADPIKTMAVEAWNNILANDTTLFEDEKIELPDVTLNKDHIRSSIGLLYQAIIDNFQIAKVFCACIEPYNIHLWSHYADEHKGIVLEFSPDLKSDSHFQLLTNVLYSDIRPALWSSPEELIKTAFEYSTQEEAKRFVQECIYTKSKDWDKEQEVRMIYFIDNKSDYYNIEFLASELKSVYLGCSIDECDQIKILEILNQKFPSTKKYKMIKNPFQYKLDFIEL